MGIFRKIAMFIPHKILNYSYCPNFSKKRVIFHRDIAKVQKQMKYQLTASGNNRKLEKKKKRSSFLNVCHFFCNFSLENDE